MTAILGVDYGTGLLGMLPVVMWFTKLLYLREEEEEEEERL